MENKQGTTVSDMATTAIAAASKTPFKTAFLLTIGIGLAHVALFVGTIVTILVIFKTLFGGT